MTLLELENTIVVYATIGGASNVEKNFFLYEAYKKNILIAGILYV